MNLSVLGLRVFLVLTMLLTSIISSFGQAKTYSNLEVGTGISGFIPYNGKYDYDYTTSVAVYKIRSGISKRIAYNQGFIFNDKLSLSIGFGWQRKEVLTSFSYNPDCCSGYSGDSVKLHLNYFTIPLMLYVRFGKHKKMVYSVGVVSGALISGKFKGEVYHGFETNVSGGYAFETQNNFEITELIRNNTISVKSGIGYEFVLSDNISFLT